MISALKHWQRLASENAESPLLKTFQTENTLHKGSGSASVQ